MFSCSWAHGKTRADSIFHSIKGAIRSQEAIRCRTLPSFCVLQSDAFMLRLVPSSGWYSLLQSTLNSPKKNSPFICQIHE